ncbi:MULTISPECIES: EexN family lipoprotein [Gammaproteobacteria]|jgi:hypothetical protein|uniref:EexN family lipoprotein n=1 Tax=Oceanobacter antarcticus TaxID=3133425 RepID=A0ABW8NPZ1_9GAMM|nr:EexN family lipoprotein [Porticoccus sp.]MAZ69819.1 entry exclusion lipoprotein TrbK [Porticoccus sp.]|tara:strand:+ start:7750 stop:8031 length:282 start_codon:yes stop_codon:yes gene_type:complete
MKRLSILLVVALLSACGEKPTSIEKPSADVPLTDTVESLLADPGRRKELREQCRLNRAELGDKLCNIVAEATNKAFLGDGKVPYTPPKEKPAF